MTPEEAKEIAAASIKGCTVTEIEEFDSLYAVYFVNDEYLESGDIADLAIGNGPRMIVKETGEMFITGSGFTGEDYAKAYEACGDIYGRLVDSIAILKCPDNSKNVENILFLKQTFQISLKEAQSIFYKLQEGISVRLDLSRHQHVEYLVPILKDKGFEVRQLWSTEC